MYGDGYHVSRRLTLRPMTAFSEDGLLVSLWRNSASARAAFWRTSVVTPDSHAAWLAAKSPLDLVWMVEGPNGDPVGMAGLIVDPDAHTGEAGRYFIDTRYRGQGYALELDWCVLSYAFDLLRLDSMWLDAYASNAAILRTHQKAGWQTAGVDLPGHTQPGGPVVHMTMMADEWARTWAPAFTREYGYRAFARGGYVEIPADAELLVVE